MKPWRHIISDLFRVEEIGWRSGGGTRRFPETLRPVALSGKALFWSAAAIAISLAIGRLA